MREITPASRDTAVHDIVGGMVAGMAATMAMTVMMLAAQRLGLVGTQPPEKITRRLLNRVSPLAGRGMRQEASTGAHLAFGTGAGAAFGVVRRFLPMAPVGLAGMAYGLSIYLLSYVGWLPALGLMPPPTDDRPGRQPSLVAGHLVYGVVLGIVSRRLPHRSPD